MRSCKVAKFGCTDSSHGSHGPSFTSLSWRSSVLGSVCSCNGFGCFLPDNAARVSSCNLTRQHRLKHQHPSRSRIIKRLSRFRPQPFRPNDMKLFAAGLSHKTTPVEIREQLAVNQAELADRARKLKSRGVLDEIVLLSTCNRVELYGTTQRSGSDIKSLFQVLSCQAPELGPYIYLHEDADAARHLFRVTAGLDSMVLGETEITGQIKTAYEIARTSGLTGRLLNRVFQRAFQAAKEIRTRTGIGRGAVSIKSAAVELVGRTLGDFSSSIMVIGAGEMADSCVRSLTKKGARSILISNRSFDRALDLAIRCGGEAICFGDCLFGMRDV